MGIGMASPYLVLSANPKWVDKLPRTGPASELVKQVMGLLLLAASAYFVGSGILALVSDYPYLAPKLHYWVIALFGVLAGGLLLVRTIQITKKALPRILFSIIGLVVGFMAVAVAVNFTDQARREHENGKIWQKYTPQLVQSSLDEGKVVVMDFTAEWCINCKVLKATVLNVNPVQGVLSGEDVVSIKVDLTSRKAKGWSKLKEFGQTGIPTLVIMGGEIDEPWISNAYGRDQVMTALRDAGAVE